MADIAQYKKDIQNAEKGNEVKGTIIDALNGISNDGPSAVTFHGLRADGYVISGRTYGVNGPYSTKSLEYRMNTIINKIHKSNTPCHPLYVEDPSLLNALKDTLLTTRGIRLIVGRLDKFPK